MDFFLPDLVDALKESSSLESLHSNCLRFTRELDLDHFLFGYWIALPEGKNSLLVMHNYPDPWWQRYLVNGYLNFDPVVAHCTRKVSPVRWDTLASLASSKSPAWALLGEAREFGLRSGASFPVQSHREETTLLSIASQRDTSSIQGIIKSAAPHTQFFACHLLEAARRIALERGLFNNPRQLNDFEYGCLPLLEKPDLQLDALRRPLAAEDMPG